MPTSPRVCIYTVGHSNHRFEHFAKLLHIHGVEVFADVRSQPYSRHVPHFSKHAIEAALTDDGIEYVPLGDRLGGKLGAGYIDANGNVDYRRRQSEPDFAAGIRALIETARARTTAIMCAEENPLRCHRRSLITPALSQVGVDVVHIRGDGTLQGERHVALRSQLPLF